MTNVKKLLQLNERELQLVIIDKLIGLEKAMEKKVAFLPVDQAIEAFWAFLQQKQREPLAYRHALDLFKERFTGRNIAEVTADEIEPWFTATWGSQANNSVRNRHAQLSGLFKFANLVLKRKGSPTFHNPMDLVEKPKATMRAPKSVPVETMRKIISSPKKLRHRVWLGILATAGLRLKELRKLRVEDVSDQVLTLREPKSGRKTEHAVIPGTLAEMTKQYIEGAGLGPKDLVCPVNAAAMSQVVARYTKRAGVKLSPHEFRKWCATFWDREGEPKMAAFVLRHKGGVQDPDGNDALYGTYVAGLTVEEAIGKVERMEEVLYGD